MIKKTCVMLSTLLCLTTAVKAQEVLVSESVEQGSDDEGPNGKFYGHSFVAVSFLQEGGRPTFKSHPLKSYDISFGTRLKWRIARKVSWGTDVEFIWSRVFVEQVEDKNFLDNVTHAKELVQGSKIGIAPFFRVNLGKVGNSLGKYIQVGGFVDWAYSQTHYFQDDVEPGIIGGASVEVTLSDLNYVNAFSYGPVARIGIGNWSLFYKYRLSNLIRQDKFAFDLAPHAIGIEVALR